MKKDAISAKLIMEFQTQTQKSLKASLGQKFKDK
jgi:hypothetical protein